MKKDKKLSSPSRKREEAAELEYELWASRVCWAGCVGVAVEVVEVIVTIVVISTINRQ